MIFFMIFSSFRAGQYIAHSELLTLDLYAVLPRVNSANGEALDEVKPRG
jgi:hypothetical protein